MCCVRQCCQGARDTIGTDPRTPCSATPCTQSSHLSQLHFSSMCRLRRSWLSLLRAAHHCLHEAMSKLWASTPGTHQGAAQLCVTAALHSQRRQPAWQERAPAWQPQCQQKLPCRQGPQQRLLRPPWCHWLTHSQRQWRQERVCSLLWRHRLTCTQRSVPRQLT